MADDAYDDIPEVSPEQAQQMGLQDASPPAGNSGEGTTAPEAHDDIPEVSAEDAKRMGLQPAGPSSSMLGAAARGAAESALPLAASLPAMGAGAEVGGAAGFALAGPPGAAVGGFLGAVGGGMYGAYKGSQLQDWLMDKMGLKEGEGIFSDKQKQADIEQHPYAREAGSLATNALAFAVNPEATIGQRVLGAGAFGGIEAGQEAYNEGTFDPTKIAMAAATGAILPGQRSWAEKLSGVGERAARAVVGDAHRPVAGTQGIAQEPIKPEENDEDAIGAENKIDRDGGNDGRYAKKTAEAGEAPSMGTIKPDEMAALQASLDKNSPAARANPPEQSQVPEREPQQIETGLKQEPVPEREPSPAEQNEPQPPIDTGIAAASKIYERPATQQEYAHPDPDFTGTIIQRGEDTPHLAVTTDGKRVQVDSNVPPVIDVGGRQLDPAYPLAVRAVKAHEAAELVDKAVKSGEVAKPDENLMFSTADHMGELAQKQWLERNGYDYDKYNEALQKVRDEAVPPEVRAEVNRMRENPEEVIAPRNEADYADAALGHRETKAQPQPEVSGGSTTARKPLNANQLRQDAVGNGPVTATVTKPAPGSKLINNTLDRLRAAGRTKEADLLSAMPEGAKKLDAAAKLNASMANRTGGVKNPTQPIKAPRIRNPEVKEALKIDDLGVTAKTAADAAKKTKAIEAIKGNDQQKGAYNEFPPPAKAESTNELRQRLLKAMDRATELNGGSDPVKAYKPADAPREWYWLHDAREVIRGKRSADQFRADEKLLRGSDEDFQAFKRERLDANNQKFNKRTGDEVVAGAQAEQAKRFDQAAAEASAAGESASPRVDADEPGLPAREMKIAEPVKDQLVSDNDKAINNLKATFDDNRVNVDNLPPKPAQAAKPKFEADAEKMREGMAKLKAARLARDKAKEVQEAKVTEPKPEVSEVAKKEVNEAVANVKAKGKDEAVVPEAKSLKEFWNDDKGALDADKVISAYRAQRKTLRGALERYFGMTFSDVARKFSDRLAQNISDKNQIEASMHSLLDAKWHMWKTVPKEKTFAYLKALEAVKDVNDRSLMMKELTDRGLSSEEARWMADEAPDHRDILDQIFKDDEAHGSMASYIANYVPHIFTNKRINGLTAEQWIEQHVKSLGANWYQKQRTFATLEEAVKHGYEIKFENPIDMIHARLAASVNTNMLIKTLRGLQEDGLAYPVKDAPDGPKATWKAKFNLPDGQQWIIHPEGEHLWNNAMVARGLSQMNNVWGSIYSGWMKLKNVWAPIELMGSSFHEVHVAANINPAVNFTRAIQLTKSDPANALKYFGKAAKWSLTDPLFALPLDKLGGGIGKRIDELSGNRFSEYSGRQLQDWWSLDRKNMNPQQKMWTDLAKEAGFSPSQAAEEVIGAKRALSRALAKGDYLGASVPAMRRAIELSQSWMFKYQIPAMKNAAFQRNVEAAFQMDPTLASNHIKRMAVLREIAKNIDSRYGELFYKNLFWNRYLKDTGIATFLSLSWNYGQFHQAAGALNNAKIALQDMVGGGAKLTPRQRDIYNASDRGTFVASYIGMSMASAGLLSYALSGQMPSGLDWFFPRTGINNPDGRPGRLSTPFNTREPFMLAGHIDESGGGLSGFVGGLYHFLYNKMIISPLMEALTNRDFFGKKLFDRDAPFYKGVLQLVDSTLGNHLDPIGHTSAVRAEQQGGGTRGKALAYAGFGPAPKYISNTSMENKINSHFNEEGTAYSHPYEYGEKTGLGHGLVQDALRGQGAIGGALKSAGIVSGDDKLKSEARTEHRAEINRGKQTGDKELERKGRIGMATEGGMSNRLANRIRPEEEFQWKYSRLPIETKISLAKEMSPEDFKKYVYFPRVSKKDRAAIVQAIPQPSVKAAGLP